MKTILIRTDHATQHYGDDIKNCPGCQFKQGVAAWKPGGITLCCIAAIVATIVAVLIMSLMPLPTP